MKPGIYPGLSFQEYCAIPAINKSGLDLIANSPLHYWANYLDPNREPEGESTPAKKLGSAIHTKILEESLFTGRYAVVPEDAPRRPSITQLNAKKPSDETLAAIRWWERFNSESQGKEILTEEQIKTCKLVASSVSSSVAAKELLSGGQPEVTIVWETKVILDDGTEVQVPCKARVDYLSVALLDVKSTQSAAPADFAKSVANYRYHVQAAFYSDGYRELTGETLPFIFLAFETSSPYACAFYLADEAMMDVGRKLYLPLVKKYAECVRRNKWPGYADEIRSLGLPAWAAKGTEYDQSI